MLAAEVRIARDTGLTNSDDLAQNDTCRLCGLVAALQKPCKRLPTSTDACLHTEDCNVYEFIVMGGRAIKDISLLLAEDWHAALNLTL
jgi:hypothetical protein